MPQGSVLGPLLFLIYINDLPDPLLHSSVYLFADDTKLMKASTTSDSVNQLQSDIDSLQSWCHQWKLKLNPCKCVGMHFAMLPTPHPSLFINNTSINFVEHYRDLGIIMTSNLDWSKQYNHICSKAYFTLNLLRRTITTSDIYVKKRLYIALVRSHLSYCSQLWRP